jgi:hypothetical protein
MKRKHRQTQQDIERCYFEMFRKVYPLPSDAVACYGDKPDVIVSGTIGIEITTLYVTDGVSEDSEHIQRERRTTAVAKAQRLYQQDTRNNIELFFGFDRKRPIRRVDTLAKQLRSFAGRVESVDDGEISRELFP